MPQTEEELKEFLRSILFNRGDFAPSLVVQCLIEVCRENAQLSQMDRKQWQKTVTVLSKTLQHII